MMLRQMKKIQTKQTTNFFEQPQVVNFGVSGVKKEKSKPIILKPVKINKRLQKSVGSKWGPRKSRFQRFLDFLRGI